MIRKLVSVFSSNYLMALLFVIFASSMAAGTFIENSYNTNTARIIIYNSWWFELILLLFTINFVCNIGKYKLFRKDKLVILGLHFAFIFIITGAFITRYFGYEGIVSLREGESKQEILSDKAYLTAEIETKGSQKRTVLSRPLLLSQKTDYNNDFAIHVNHQNKPVDIIYSRFIMNAKQVFKQDKKGNKYLKIVTVDDNVRVDHFIKDGEILKTPNVTFTYNRPMINAINFTSEIDGRLFIKVPINGSFLEMSSGNSGNVIANDKSLLHVKSLYNFNNIQFVVPFLPQNGVLDVKSDFKYDNKGENDALELKIKIGNISKDVILFGKEKKKGEPEIVLIDDMRLKLSYGSMEYKLPFKIRLDDFIAEKYPGTLNSYSSFESRVSVLDENKKTEERIYMNHVLDYDGYRFFQASYHPDEKGTILAVNHDNLGTNVTYLGYALLYLSLILLLFDKKSRFGVVRKKLNNYSKNGFVSILLFFSLFSLSSFGQEMNHSEKAVVKLRLDSIINFYAVPVKHAELFSKLVVQDEVGRMKPLNTYSSELLRKISKNDYYNGLNSDQILISIMQRPKVWYNVPLIYLKKDNDSLRKLIGLKADEKYAALADFFDSNGQYKLAHQAKDSYRSLLPNQYEKDFIETDKRVNIFYNIIIGSVLKVFPVPNDLNNKWISSSETEHSGVEDKDLLYIKNILPLYFTSLVTSFDEDNYSKSDSLLLSIERYQIKFGSKVRPSKDKISAELLYNKYDVFKELFKWYMYAGVLMLVLSLLNIFKPRKFFRTCLRIMHYLVLGLFTLQSLGLICRWYISGHAPWSDAYETIIYISWATMLFGLILGRKSSLTVASTAFVASMILMVAHWNWLDPSIANLQPVLNSYWLMIHVAIIVASYGPFTLAMILGLVSMIMMCFLNESNKKLLSDAITKVLLITEMSLTVGLIMLTIGNFLGGQWANESWGRYWAWDPKETWALISIMIYAFVLHMRLVPILRGKWILALFSVLPYYSILMTYFGVNFYLSGLHSYAKGDKVITPIYIYYSLAILFVLAILSFYKQKTFLKS